MKFSKKQKNLVDLGKIYQEGSSVKETSSMIT